nr:protein arginine N-methyltransferase 1.6 [Ipomoea batatas]
MSSGSRMFQLKLDPLTGNSESVVIGGERHSRANSNSTSCHNVRLALIPRGWLQRACESYLPMVKLMRKVLRANGIERGIHIINERSDELEVGRDIASRADVLVSSVS